MASEFYFTNHRNNTCILPVAPSDVTIRAETSDSASTIIGRGEVNRVGEQKIKSIKISGIFPNEAKNLPYVTKKKHWIKAESYITFFKNIEKSRRHCRLVVTKANISLPVTISSFEYGRENGNPNEFTFNLELTEFRRVKAERLRLSRKKKHSRHGRRRSKPMHKISRGSKVTVNGNAYLYKNSNSNAKFIRRKRCRITLVSRHSKHPYYVKAVDGTNLGWISKGAIK